MKQPKSEAPARSWGRKAVKAFNNTAKLQLDLYHADPSDAGAFDLTGSKPVYIAYRDQLLRPRAAAALLRPFRGLASLTCLQLDSKGQYTGLNAVLPVLPQLQCLDMTRCPHTSSDLRVIAKHLSKLQELLLCSNTDLAVKVVYKAGDIAALSSLPRLQQLRLRVAAAKCDYKDCELVAAVSAGTGSN